MTVATSTSKSGPYAGAGITGPFTVGFRFLENSHLQVIRTSTSGVETTLVLTADYSVTGAGASSGAVTLVTALAVGEKLTIIRNVPFTQDADYVQNDAFPAESHERALDKLTMEIQQVKEATDRSLKVGPSSSTSPEFYMQYVQEAIDGAAAAEISAEQAAASASAAAASEVAAGASAAAAATSETNAELAEQSAEAALASVADAMELLNPRYVQFSGTGSQVDFTLPVVLTTEDVIDVFVGGVYQQKATYSTTGSVLTFSAAPPTGTNNIEVRIAPSVAWVEPNSEDWGLITASVTSTKDYGALF
jgi:hypothetical protein